MRSDALAVLAAFCALSAPAGGVQETFAAHREAILAAGVTNLAGTVYVVGKAVSPRSRGDSVGWTKAEEDAKWRLGDLHRASAPWGVDVDDGEKDAAWLEYRAAHPERFRVAGMQRVWTQKTPPDGYAVVLSFPASVAAPPDAGALAGAVARVREKRRLAEEAAKAAESKAGARKVLEDGTVRQQQLDEDMAL